MEHRVRAAAPARCSRWLASLATPDIIAALSFLSPLLPHAQFANMRRAFNRYCRRAAMAAVGLRPWLRKLHGLVTPALDGTAVALAEGHLQARPDWGGLRLAASADCLAALSGR